MLQLEEINENSFSLNWFSLNKGSIDRMLNFWSEVFWLMKPENFRMKIYDKDDHKIVRCWYVNGKTFVPSMESFLVYKDKINVDKQVALKNPKVWLLAWKLGYLRFPKVWKRTSVWLSENGRDACFVMKDGETAVKFRDQFGHSVIVPLRLLDRIYSYREVHKNSKL